MWNESFVVLGGHKEAGWPSHWLHLCPPPQVVYKRESGGYGILIPQKA